MTERVIELPSVDRPRVSIALVTYGRAELALDAIESIREHTDPCYEMIIVDNASRDDTVATLRSAVHGAILIENPANMGFGAGVNHAVLHGRGEYVLVLNSDIVVEPDWLPPLINALDTDPTLGAVTPQLLNVEGSLQEAGASVGPDGNTWPFVDVPGEPQANAFTRRVEYASAACLLVRRAAFDEVGGFDVVYGIGYFEDVELALDLADHGFAIGYVPQSRVRHVRNASSDLQTATARSAVNRKIFLDRWSDVIAGNPAVAPDGATVRALLAARDSLTVDRLLVVVPDDLPALEVAAMATRIATLWPHIRVTVLSIGRGDEGDAALLAAGVEVARTTLDSIGRWAMQRVAHYTAIVVPNTPDAQRCVPDLAAAQPQAVRAIVRTAGDAHRPDHAARQPWDVEIHIGPVDDDPAGAAATVRLPAPTSGLDAWPDPADCVRVIESLGASPRYVRRHVSPPAPRAR